MSDKTLVERLIESKPVDCVALARMFGVECSDYKTCASCNYAVAIADAIEREYLPRPCFEDGEPVKPGDTIVVDGFEFVVSGFGIGCDGKTLLYGVDEHVSEIETGARVKRPEPEVLDADGVPIIVGDVVWFVNGVERFDVLGIESYAHVHIGRKDNTSTDAFVYPFELTHKQPDSLERIEEDARKNAYDYWHCRGSNCRDCPAAIDGKKPYEHYGVTNCAYAKDIDLLRRQREVLERMRDEF